VRTHTRNLYRKLEVNDRAAALAIAWREGLVR
jgi:DNA-binding CsgD family transcriptional regulator